MPFHLALLLAALFAAAQEQSPAQPRIPSTSLCTGEYSISCGASADDQKLAHKRFDAGLKLKREGRNEAALAEFEAAAQLVPRNIDYVTAREFVKQEIVLTDIRHGDDALAAGNEIEALAAFRTALEVDPASATAADRLRQAAHVSVPSPEQRPLLRSAGPPRIVVPAPQQGVRNFHLRTDTKSLLVQVAQAYGITAQVDDAVASRPVRFDLNNADFATAMQTAELMAHTFSVPVTEHQILEEPDTPVSHAQHERVGLETFYISNLSTPTDLNEVVNMLRGVLEARQLSIVSSESAITLRAPIATLREAEQLVASLQEGKPQVMIEVTVYQVSHTMLRDIGVALPLQFSMFNLSNVQQALSGTNLQSILAGLGQNGAVNSQSVSAILAQAAGQNSDLAALLANPLATFGGGRTFFGVGIPPATLKLSLNSSNIQQLDRLTLQTPHGTDANFHFGVRYPVLTASYSAVYNLPGLSQLTGGNQNLAAFPAVNYQDLGLSVKANPTIHSGNDVTLKLDIQIQALGASTVNGIPELDNRQYQGTINLKDGQTAVVAGSISEQDSRNIQGIPALSRIPVLGAAVSERNTQINDDELLITITPHITRESLHKSDVIVMTP